MIKANQRFFNGLLVVFDALVILSSFLIAWYLKFESGLLTYELHLSFVEYVRQLAFSVPVLLVVYYMNDLYSSKRVKKLPQEIISVVLSNAVVLVLIMSLLYVIKQFDISRSFIMLFITTNVLLSTLERGSLRFILRFIRSKGYNIKYVLLIGAGELGIRYLEVIRRNRFLGLEVMGILDDDDSKQSKNILGVPVIGKIEDLETILDNHYLDEVVIAIPLKAYEKLQDIIATCEKQGIKSQIIPDYLRYIPAKPHIDEIEDVPIINTRYVPLDNIVYRIIKRVFDIVTASVILIVFSPLMIAIAVAIKLTSEGPVIFKQNRIGYNRKPFVMYKFRTMICQSDEESDETWTTKNDGRITKIGLYLRRSSLDELPQLFNVLKGDMSIVGPRPERPYFVEQFKKEIPKYMIKHQVRPGLTGWAQVNGWRGDTSIVERINHDIYYIENWNIFLDLRILWLTLIRGFIHKNAY